jgi:hypothetical protein
MFGIDFITNVAMNNPVEILLWTHGFFVALALRRGRIKTILDKTLPGQSDSEKGGD